MNDIINLKRIELEIKKEEFVCIIGDVGSGKSSLLHAILGEMNYLEPSLYEQRRNDPITDELLSEI